MAYGGVGSEETVMGRLVAPTLSWGVWNVKVNYDECAQWLIS